MVAATKPPAFAEGYGGQAKVEKHGAIRYPKPVENPIALAALPALPAARVRWTREFR
jgi:hypothetical protein